MTESKQDKKDPPSPYLAGLKKARTIAGRYNLAGQDEEANKIQDAIDRAIEREEKKSG